MPHEPVDHDADLRERMYRETQAALNPRHSETLERCNRTDGLMCRHDLVRGVLVSDLIGPDDGPHGQTAIFGPPPVPVIRDGRIQMLDD